MIPAPVSVIMPVHNGAAYVAAAVESALRQTRPPAEIIVVDDGSTDATAQILATLPAPVRVLRHHQPSGPGRARNEAIAAARSNLIAFLDADDLWLPDKLEQQLVAASVHPDFGIVTTDVESFMDDGQVVRHSLRQMYPVRSGYVLQELLQNNWITTSAALVPRARLQEAGGFEETPCRLGEDWALWMRIAAAHPVYFVERMLTRRRIHPMSLGHGDPEASFRDLMRHLDGFQRDIPALQAQPHLVRAARYRICVGRGIQDVHSGHPVAARAKLRAAWRLRPLSLRPAFWQLLSCIPPRYLTRAKHHLLRRRSSV